MTDLLNHTGVETDPERASLADLIESLPSGAVPVLRELAESAREVAETIGPDGVDLLRVVQRMFTRSVNEFFTAEHVSMQMTAQQLRRLQASADPDRLMLPEPEPEPRGDVLLDDVLRQRRSARDYEATPLDLATFSSTLHRAFGRTGTEDGYGVRGLPLYPYPSMGGLSAFEVGVVAQNVDGVPRGYYRYDQVGHALEPRIRGDMRLAVQDATFESDWLLYAPAVIVLAHDAKAFAWKYHTRGYRISHFDTGAALQCLYLAAWSAGLGACAVAGFLDEQINEVLGYDGLDSYVSLVVGVGRPATPVLARTATTE